MTNAEVAEYRHDVISIKKSRSVSVKPRVTVLADQVSDVTVCNRPNDVKQTTASDCVLSKPVDIEGSGEKTEAENRAKSSFEICGIQVGGSSDISCVKVTSSSEVAKLKMTDNTEASGVKVDDIDRVLIDENGILKADNKDASGVNVTDMMVAINRHDVDFSCINAAKVSGVKSPDCKEVSNVKIVDNVEIGDVQISDHTKIRGVKISDHMEVSGVKVVISSDVTTSSQSISPARDTQFRTEF